MPAASLLSGRREGHSSTGAPYRADPFFTTKPGGTGLGLSIARRIVEAHGGEIEYRSQPGEGTSFIIHLPSDAGPVLAGAQS